jgi:hypothetical protein
MGMKDCLIKPVQPSELQAALERSKLAVQNQIDRATTFANGPISGPKSNTVDAAGAEACAVPLTQEQCPVDCPVDITDETMRKFSSRHGSALPLLPEVSYFSPMPEETKRSDDREKIQGSPPAEVGDYGERLRQLETDVKDLAALFKHLVNSSPHGEQLLFMTLGRIEEQDEAVMRFNETLRDLLKRKGLD